MSGKWPGGFIKKTAPTVVGPVDGEGGSASGIWTLDQAADYEQRGLWPAPTIPRALYAWGYNQTGAMGDGSTTDKSSPVQIGSLLTWKNPPHIGKATSAAVDNEGRLWTWGRGSNGALGHGNTTTLSSPTQVGALTTWQSVQVGATACLAVKTDGTLWSWGLNTAGQLGLGNTTNYSSPVQVGALTTWLTVAGGQYFSAAIKTDGTLWAWGNNSQGSLGNSAIGTNISSPIQVGALTNWLRVAAGAYMCAAIKTDGTIWTWGYNTVGQLGQGNTTRTSSPVQVGALTTWTSIEPGGYTVLALKTDGTLYAWGNNNYGDLGVGDTTNRSSPTQVGSLTTWASAASFGNNGIAIKTDGTLWTWGRNNYGSLGLGNTTQYSSPVQVGTNTNWSGVAGGSRLNSITMFATTG
jgi:alpha-tubulin suppressor-like RCC1 family protein